MNFRSDHLLIYLLVDRTTYLLTQSLPHPLFLNRIRHLKGRNCVTRQEGCTSLLSNNLEPENRCVSSKRNVYYVELIGTPFTHLWILPT